MDTSRKALAIGSPLFLLFFVKAIMEKIDIIEIVFIGLYTSVSVWCVYEWWNDRKKFKTWKKHWKEIKDMIDWL